MYLQYSAAQQTIEWIIASNSFKNIISFDELQQGYGLTIFQSNNFLYSKEDYIKVVKTLPFMMLKTLFLCQCDKYLITISGIILIVPFSFNKMIH